MGPTDRGVSRRDFVKAAVAIGGTSALSACLDREGAPDLDTGPEDLSALPARQHAWNGRSRGTRPETSPRRATTFSSCWTMPARDAD